MEYNITLLYKEYFISFEKTWKKKKKNADVSIFRSESRSLFARLQTSSKKEGLKFAVEIESQNNVLNGVPK